MDHRLAALGRRHVQNANWPGFGMLAPKWQSHVTQGDNAKEPSRPLARC